MMIFGVTKAKKHRETAMVDNQGIGEKRMELKDVVILKAIMTVFVVFYHCGCIYAIRGWGAFGRTSPVFYLNT